MTVTEWAISTVVEEVGSVGEEVRLVVLERGGKGAATTRALAARARRREVIGERMLSCCDDVGDAIWVGGLVGGTGEITDP